jgi:Holliday junction resolvase RusA-like endonuclease
MTLVHWVGKAVSDNRKTIRDSHGARRNSSEYTAYRASVAAAIRSQCPTARYDYAGMSVQFSLDARADPANFLKGLLDGIQDSGIVPNDRRLEPILLLEKETHGRGRDDSAWIVLWPARGR